jgi:hypothetical protein
VAFEIKAHRADLVRDLRDRYKHQPVADCVNELYFVLPDGLLTSDDHYNLPFGAGIITVYRDGRKRWAGKSRTRITRQATLNMMPNTPLGMVNALTARSLYGGASSGRLVLEWERAPALARAREAA